LFDVHDQRIMEKESARSQTLEQLHERRKQVVRLYRQGTKIMQIVTMTGLSYPTVRSAIDRFEAGGWGAIRPAARGRAKGDGARERFEAEQQEHQAKVARRQAQRDVGKKPRGKEPEPPQSGPRDSDQVSLTDADSRIMPVSGGGFEQSYNAQAAVDTDTMLVIATHVSQAPNDKREVLPILDELGALPKPLGQVNALLADTGYCSQANVQHCQAHHIEPLLAMRRDSHHLPVLERFAPDAPAPESAKKSF
jgi:hypothetical protein